MLRYKSWGERCRSRGMAAGDAAAAGGLPIPLHLTDNRERKSFGYRNRPQVIYKNMGPVLLLSATYEPLRIISWQNAISMFFLGKVEVIEEYDRPIRSVSLTIKAPAVVRLLKFLKVGRRAPPLSRSNILARDNFTCQYCGCELSAKEATLDHVVPRSQGGGTTWSNIVCACSACNRRKGGRTPHEARMKLLSKPVKPDWLPVLTIKFHGQVPPSWHSFLIPFSKPRRG